MKHGHTKKGNVSVSDMGTHTGLHVCPLSVHWNSNVDMAWTQSQLGKDTADKNKKKKEKT